MNPLGYNDVANEFDRWQVANPQKKMTLSEYAQLQDMAEGAPTRQAAYNDNFIKHISRNVDTALAPVSDFVAPAGEGLDILAHSVVPSYTGHAGEAAMRGTPRTLAEFAGYLVPGGGEVAAGARLAGLAAKGVGMADAAMRGYTETDSPLVGAIDAAGLPFSNAAIGLGEKLGGKLLTRGLAGQVENAIATGGKIAAPTASPLMDQLATFIGGNVGGLAAGEVQQQASSLAQGQGLVNPLTVENLVGNIAGLAPFAAKPALDAFHGRFAPQMAEARAQVLAPYEAELARRDAVTRAAETRDFVTGAEQANVPSVLSSPVFGTDSVPTQVARADAVGKLIPRSMEEYIASRKTPGELPATNPALDYDHPALVGQSVDLAEQAPQIAQTFADGIKVEYLGKKHLVMEGVGEPVDQWQVKKPGEERGQTLTTEQMKQQGYLVDTFKLSMTRPEDVNTVELLTKFIADVNQNLNSTWAEQTQRENTAKADLDRAANLRKTLGITGISETPETSKQEVTAFNPLALKELQSEGRVPVITPDWLKNTFGIMLDRSLVDTPQDAYLHTVQKVANLMSDLGVKAKEQKATELQQRAELQSSTRRKTEPELDAAHQLNVQQLPQDLQDWLNNQSLEDKRVTKFGGKTPQSVWPFRRELVDQAVKNLDRTTGMTKVTVAQGKERTPVTLSLPLEQAVKGVQTVQTPEGPKEVSFIKSRALKTSAGERTSVGTQSLEAMGENLAAQEGAKPVEQDVTEAMAEQVGSATREVKDFGEGPEVVQTPTAEAPESRSFNEQDTNRMAEPRDKIREELDRIYKQGSSTEVFGNYAGLFEARMPNETKDKIRRLFGMAVEAQLTNSKDLQRRFAAEWYGRDPKTIDPVTMRDALRSFWGGPNMPRFDAFVQKVAQVTGVKDLTSQAMKSGMYTQALHGVVAEGMQDLRPGLQQALQEHALLQGMGPEAQAHYVATGMKFVDLIKGLDQYKFSKIDIEDPLSRERIAQKVSEDLQVAGLHGMAYMTPEGKLVRNPFIAIALGHTARRSSNQPFFNWLTLSSIGHEAIHSIDSNLEAYHKSSDPDLRQYAAAYTNMFAEASAMSPQERYMLLRGAAESVLPPQFFRAPGSMALNENIKGYISHGALDPKEFIPTYAQIYFSGLVTGGEKLNVANLLENNRWASPAVQDFMRGVYRQIGDYAGGIKIMAGASPDMAKAVDVLHAELPKLVKKDPVVASAERDVTQIANVLDRGAVTTLADGPFTRWQGGRESVATIPGEPFDFLDAKKDDFDSAKAAISIEESGGKQFYRATLANGVEVANRASATPSALFETADAARRAAERIVDEAGKVFSPTDLQFMKVAGIEFGQKTATRVNEALGLTNDHLFDQKKLNFWTRNFMPFVQAAARTGQKVAMDVAMTLLDSNRGRTNVANQLLMPTLKRTDYGKLVVNQDHPLRKLLAGDETGRPAFNAIGDLLQELGDGGKLNTKVVADQTGRLGDGFSQLRKLNPDLDTRTGAILEKLKPDVRGGVLAAVDSTLEIYHTGGNILVKSQQDHMGTRVARVLQTINKDMPYDDALQRGNLLMQGISVKNKQIVDSAVQGMTPEQAASVIDLAVGLNAPIDELTKMVAERPFFMSEQRQGQYIITSTKDGRRFVDSADNDQHVVKVGQHLKSLGHTDLQWFDKYARYGEFAGELPMQYADKFAQLEQEAYSQSLQKIAAKFGQPVADMLQNEFSPIKAVQKDLGAQGVNKLLQERKRVPAALGLDYVRNLDAYIQSMSVSTSNRSVRDRFGVMMADKSVDNAPDFRPMAEAQLQNTLRRGDRNTQQLKTMLTSYYLAGNLGSMFVEGAQAFSSLVPVLIQNGSTVAGAYKKLLGAAADATAYRTSSNKLNQLADKASEYLGTANMPKDVEKAYLYRRWLAESPDAGSHLEDNTIAPDQSAILLGRNRNGNYADLPVSTIAKNGLYRLAQGSLKMYSAVAQFNNKAAFLAAMDHVHEQGLSGDAAYQSARQIVYGSMFGGGRANSANYIAKMSMSPYMRPIVAIQSTLSSYSLGMTSLLGSLAHDSILGDKTLNPQQRKQAQKAFGVAFATQMALAGGLGMPFAAASLVIIEKLTGVQANAAVRQGLASLAGDDEELGGLFADVALNGAANQLLGVDVGGRTGLSSVLGTSAYSGFKFQDLMGPAPSVFENMANATLSLSQGEVAQAATQLVPQSFKHSAQLIDAQRTYGKPQIMDKSNNLIMEPTNMEAIMYAMGLQPSRLRQYKGEQKLLQTADDQAAQSHDRDFDSLAQKVLQGDNRSVLDYAMQQRLNNPAIDVHEILRNVADRVVSMQQPKDLLSGGNPQSWQDRAAIASTFPRGTQQSELQKLIAREQILGQMGYPMGMKPAGTAEYTQAAMTDQLVGQGLGRGQAAQKVGYMTRLLHGSAK